MHGHCCSTRVDARSHARFNLGRMSPVTLRFFTEEAERLLVAAREEPDLKTMAAMLTERGALLRVLGRLEEALTCLTGVLENIMLLGETYWQRYLVYRVYGCDDLALKDLTAMLKCDQLVPYKLLRARANMHFASRKYEEAAADYHVRKLVDCALWSMQRCVLPET